MKQLIKCPKCNTMSDSTKWNKMTSDMCNGEYVKLDKGFGSKSFLYYCPSCYQFSNGSKLKESNQS